MKGLYWKSSQRKVLYFIILAILSLFGSYLVEHFKIQKLQDNYSEKMEAASLASKAFQSIRSEKIRLHRKIDPIADPTGSGLIGEFFTPVTSNLGNLRAKQTSINPNFAALVFDYLVRAGVKKGDKVAVSLSGSFPALNIAVYSAAQVLDIDLVIISSFTSSQWGANDPEFLWPDMERVLINQKVLKYASSVYTWGGVEDQAFGIQEEGFNSLKAAASKRSFPILKSKNYEESFEERIKLYSFRLPISEYKAYINVGGGTVSVGTKKSSSDFSPGLNLKHPIRSGGRDSVMKRFARVGVPVIHIVRIEELARENGFTLTPNKLPNIGEGKIFQRQEYNLWLSGSVLFGILFLLYLFFKRDSFIEEDRDESI
ncbi:poly-gamma-glutamate system protein [Leptospira sarikeiensis]|uniref:Poly-gamma-glutamate system protein n=1 Tax=Leptospira sarikeiensis TaxID=2484943 RepID=A0A4R9K005_9LEPT|nr:poly-gamma-glutamate system protein [Leptospira sarikeiensis]TGL58334.1 poly-gamma-glutamate system protein [Leptospira sarikeiensis]